MDSIQFYLASSLEKVFLTRRPLKMENGTQLSTWRGAHAAVQLVCEAAPGTNAKRFAIDVQGAPCAVKIYEVENVPSQLAIRSDGAADDNYIPREPGLFPDALPLAAEPELRALAGQCRALWLRFEAAEETPAGTYPIVIRASSEDGECYACDFVLHIADAVLPDQKLIHTEWFHADCLADYYRVEPWSEEHWRIVEHFIAFAARHGINMILTPVVTPALDTQIGGERTTVQLVDVTLENGEYRFGFDKLRRWVEICQKHGVKYLEIAHPYTQWGAKAAPKVMATVDGVQKRIFGWDTPATGEAYRQFLYAFIPALKAALAEMGMDREHVYYHISDEPNADNMEFYQAAKEQIDPLYDDCIVIDALSNVEFYRKGLVSHPIPCNNHIEPFIEAKVPDLWTYYCVGQAVDVPNRFFAMPSARNRIMGVLLYLYDLKGFLQWGFNFYNTQYSIRHIDPWRVTDAGMAFPSGDAFIVYPGEDGEPVTSIRAEVQDDALLDLRALEALEAKIGRAGVEKIIYANAPMDKITFTDYPHDPQYLLALREAVAQALEA